METARNSFYEDPRVLTISIHQSGYSLYPGTGFVNELGEGRAVGSSINLPLPKQTGEEDFLWALAELLTACGPAFQPDLLVTQLGADTHHGDPLAELSLTMPAYPRLARLLHDFVHEHTAGRWLATGGGGYQADTVVPRVWTMYFAEMAGRPETVRAEWLEDRDPAQVALDRRGQIESALAYVLDHAAPKLEALASQQ